MSSPALSTALSPATAALLPLFLSPFGAASLTYLLMLVAYRWHRVRAFHVSIMGSCMAFDLVMPIYLVTHRRWWHRLVEQGDLFSFGIWMHLGVLVALYALEAAQLFSALHLLRGEPSARTQHRQQAQALLLVRALVIASGAGLAE